MLGNRDEVFVMSSEGKVLRERPTSGCRDR
jgi:hypothetical protein